jgi:hypothetical protein
MKVAVEEDAATRERQHSAAIESTCELARLNLQAELVVAKR